MSNNTNRNFHQYRENTVALSDHAWERESQRLKHIHPERFSLIRERAVDAAANSKCHTGVKIFTHPKGDVWAIVAGRTVKTIMVTKHGQHLNEISKCNKYHVIKECRS